MRHFFGIIFLFGSMQATAQPVPFEQKALDYFMVNVFDSNYQKLKTIEFSGFTEDHMTNFEFGHNCFSTDFKLELDLINNSLNKILPKKKIILSKRSNLKVRPLHKNSSKIFKLSINQANELNNKIYVSIQLLKLSYLVDIYLFEFDKSGDVLRWCRTGVVF
jgi:hypothetical protein